MAIGNRIWSIKWCHSMILNEATHISRARHYSTLNISKTVQDIRCYNGKLLGTYALRNRIIWNDHEWLRVTARFSKTRSVERPLCDSWASCFTMTFLRVQKPNSYSTLCEVALTKSFTFGVLQILRHQQPLSVTTQTGIKRRSKILELELLQEQSILTIKQ